MLTNKATLLITIGIIIVVVVAVVAVLAQGQGTQSIPSAAISPSDYQTQFAQTGAAHLLVDVRTPEEFASGHIHGAVNISLQTLPDRLSEIPHDIPVIVYCRSGNRSGQAARLLEETGYGNIRDLGGVIAWTQHGYALE